MFCLLRWQDKRGEHTDTGTSHPLRSVATWTGAVVATSGILTDLIVSALMSSISALIDVYKKATHEKCNHSGKYLPVSFFFNSFISNSVNTTYTEILWVLTYTCPISTFGHTIGAQINTGVPPACVFTLLIWSANPLSALVNIWWWQREERRLNPELALRTLFQAWPKLAAFYSE